MELFDRYVEAVKAAFPTPSPAMTHYINGLDTIERAVEIEDIDAELAERQSRWGALSEEEQIACQTIAATL